MTKLGFRLYHKQCPIDAGSSSVGKCMHARFVRRCKIF